MREILVMIQLDKMGRQSRLNLVASFQMQNQDRGWGIRLKHEFDTLLFVLIKEDFEPPGIF